MKKMYRITMTEDANFICKEVVLAAAFSNGAKDFNKKISLEGLKGIYLNKSIDFQSTSKDTTVELIGDSLLHIDQKVNGEILTVCIIEEVEIMELATMENVVSQRNGYGALVD